MASVQKNSGSPYWTAFIRRWDKDAGAVNGGRWARTRRSTGVPITEPKEVALDVAKEFQRIEDELCTFKADPEDFYKRSVARLMLSAKIITQGDSRPWDLFSAEWIEKKRGANSTLLKYRTQIEQFNLFLGVRKQDSLRQITEQDCNRWYSGMINAGLSNGTANQALKTIRSVFRAARDRGLVDGNPAALVSIDTSGAHERRPFTPKEVRSIFAHIDTLPKQEGKEWRTACLLALLYGLRLQDAIGRDFSEIKDGILTFVPLKKRRKGKKVPLPLTGELRKLRGKGPITPFLAALGNPSRSFARLLHAAGIDAVETKGKGKGRSQNDITFHSFRHTCNSWLANVGVDGRIRQLISDHDSPTENARYTKPDVETMRGAVEKLLKEMKS